MQTEPTPTMSFPRVLPRGPHRLAREVVDASQRGRLLDAMAHAVAEKGFGAVSVADVIARAGVSRKTFYVYFRDKLDCFLAAYDVGVEVLLATVREAGAGEIVTSADLAADAMIRAGLAAAFPRDGRPEAVWVGPRGSEVDQPFVR
jgi:AcrR family transcriptional regulator